jgi:endonuclease YncB( thermonuclease family)
VTPPLAGNLKSPGVAVDICGEDRCRVSIRTPWDISGMLMSDLPPPPPPGRPSGMAPPSPDGAWVAQPASKAWWKRWWGITLIVVGLLVPLSALADAGGDEEIAPAAAVEAEPEPEPVVEAELEPEAEPDPAAEPEAEPDPAPEPEEPEPEQVAVPAGTWTVTNIVDGDTIDVRSSDGTEERVRIIGIDTPERGECGYGEASEALGNIVVGEQVTLVAGARDDRDRYDRILRYVDVGETDVGLVLLELGLAIARYDSRDGYGLHPREDDYVAADAAMTNIACDFEPEAPTAASAPSLSIQVFRNCEELNEVYPGGVARTDVTGNRVSGELRPFGVQPHFDDDLYEANRARDGDEDGIACER